MEDTELMRPGLLAGDLADQASAQFVTLEVSLTASDRKLIDKLIPKINQAAEICSGELREHLINYQPLEDENIPGYWFSEGKYVFE